MGISDDVTKSLCAKYNIKDVNTLTIRNGVDLNGKKLFRSKKEIKDEFDVADTAKIIVTVANFRKVKNHLFLLQSYRELVRELDNTIILLIGQGIVHDPEYSEGEVRAFIDENKLNGKVILTGYRNDVWDLLSIADVFCLTSFKEGLPISMLEAMSSGLPIVGTNVHGIRDVIVHGKNGYLVELGDTVGLKDSLHKILVNDQLKSNFAAESRRMASELYSMEQCVKSYNNLFLSMMKYKESKS